MCKCTNDDEKQLSTKRSELLECDRRQHTTANAAICIDIGSTTTESAEEATTRAFKKVKHVDASATTFSIWVVHRTISPLRLSFRCVGMSSVDGMKGSFFYRSTDCSTISRLLVSDTANKKNMKLFWKGNEETHNWKESLEGAREDEERSMEILLERKKKTECHLSCL